MKVILNKIYNKEKYKCKVNYTKKASSMISTILVTGFSITILVSIIYACIGCLTPYILKQKIISIADKYMYIVQKYGYLTDKEKNSMLSDLADAGLDKNKIQLSYPAVKKDYGTIIELKITYNFTPPRFISNGEKQIIVKRNSYSKI